jgi:hypothetical protein
METEPHEESEPTTEQPDERPVYAPPTRRRHGARKKTLLLIGAGLLLLVLLAGAGYWFFLKDKGQKAPAQPVTSTRTTTESPAVTPADATPVTYKSTKLNIELTHRKDWTLKETSNEVVVTSPRTSYATSDGQATTGVFTVKFRRGVTDAQKATINKAIAPIDSEVIAYAAPTDQQRQYTTLSYAGQKDTFSFFIVTGNAAFKAGNAFSYALPLDGDFYLVAGGYGADQGDSLAFDQVPKDSMLSDTLDQALEIVKSLKIF